MVYSRGEKKKKRRKSRERVIVQPAIGQDELERDRALSGSVSSAHKERDGGESRAGETNI
jgi:hypothetical protein